MGGFFGRSSSSSSSSSSSGRLIWFSSSTFSAVLDSDCNATRTPTVVDVDL